MRCACIFSQSEEPRDGEADMYAKRLESVINTLTLFTTLSLSLTILRLTTILRSFVDGSNLVDFLRELLRPGKEARPPKQRVAPFAFVRLGERLGRSVAFLEGAVEEHFSEPRVAFGIEVVFHGPMHVRRPQKSILVLANRVTGVLVSSLIRVVLAIAVRARVFKLSKDGG